MNALVLKLISFFFFNYNIPLVYNAFFQRWLEGCPRGAGREVTPGKGTCYHALELNLGVIFLAKLGSNYGSDLLQPLFMREWKRYRSRKTRLTGGRANGERPAVEKEFDLSPCDDVNDHIQDMTALAIRFSFITLFITALPCLPALAWIANHVEGSNDLQKFLFLKRRDWPHVAWSIGSWLLVFQAITAFSVTTNTACIFYTVRWQPVQAFGDDDRKLRPNERCFAFFVCQYLVFMLMAGVGVAIPDIPEDVEIQMKRRGFLVSKLIDGTPDEEDSGDDDEEVSGRASATALAEATYARADADEDYVFSLADHAAQSLFHATAAGEAAVERAEHRALEATGAARAERRASAAAARSAAAAASYRRPSGPSIYRAEGRPRSDDPPPRLRALGMSAAAAAASPHLARSDVRSHAVTLFGRFAAAAARSEYPRPRPRRRRDSHPARTIRRRGRAAARPRNIPRLRSRHRDSPVRTFVPAPPKRVRTRNIDARGRGRRDSPARSRSFPTRSQVRGARGLRHRRGGGGEGRGLREGGGRGEEKEKEKEDAGEVGRRGHGGRSFASRARVVFLRLDARRRRGRRRRGRPRERPGSRGDEEDAEEEARALLRSGRRRAAFVSKLAVAAAARGVAHDRRGRRGARTARGAGRRRRRALLVHLRGLRRLAARVAARFLLGLV